MILVLKGGEDMRISATEDIKKLGIEILRNYTTITSDYQTQKMKIFTYMDTLQLFELEP